MNKEESIANEILRSKAKMMADHKERNTKISGEIEELGDHFSQKLDKLRKIITDQLNNQTIETDEKQNE